MDRNRIMCGGAPPRAPLLALAVGLLAALALAACGGGGGDKTDHADTAVAEQAEDASILNTVLARQIAAVGAYDLALENLRGPTRRMASVFRAQEQEHVDATIKALRGIAGDAEPEPESIEADEDLRSRADYLGFLYEVESATIDLELSAIANLSASWPRSLLAATVGNQAQHLTMLRRALGVAPAEWVPEPFENGTTPVP